MNQLTYPASAFGTQDLASTPSSAADALQARFALRVTARLTERAQDLSPDVAERLRFAREKALARASELRTVEANGSKRAARAGAAWFGLSSGWWFKLAAALPVIALVGGLVLIQHVQDNTQVAVAAEVDAALLSDDLPPKAYSDAGFAEFLKAPPQPE